MHAADRATMKRAASEPWKQTTPDKDKEGNQPLRGWQPSSR